MSNSSRYSTGSCPARVALAGNPSDAHRGAVVATVVPAVAAVVTVSGSHRFVVVGAGLEYRSLSDVDDHIRSDGAGAAQPLVPATLAALHRYLGARVDPVEIEVSTTIPRSVGLAGSSAIVLATLRALIAHHHDRSWANRLAGDPSLLAALALAAERDVLGISAGPQDRVVQSFGATMAMDFAVVDHLDVVGFTAGRYRRLGAIPGSLFVAYLPGGGNSSGAVHAAVDGNDPAVLDAMARSARQARSAAAAIDDGDRDALARAMDATYDLRAGVMDLDPRHTAMIRVARACGASANFTGSGGAIVVSAPTTAVDGETRAALSDQLGCALLEVHPAARPD